MAVRVMLADQGLDLPPPYELVALREAGDAYLHACAIAGEKGAGTLVWVRRFDLAEFAVVLEPAQPLSEARQAFFIAMNALGDALAAHAPPGRPISFDWPDAIRIDGVLVGGGRLGCPAGATENEVPPWMVFSGMLRTFVINAAEPGARPLLGGLDELGFREVDAAEIIASFSRHLLTGFDEWAESGFDPVARRWLGRLAREEGRASLAGNGDLLVFEDTKPGPVERRELAPALAAVPSWLDPSKGTPWL